MQCPPVKNRLLLSVRMYSIVHVATLTMPVLFVLSLTGVRSRDPAWVCCRVYLHDRQSNRVVDQQLTTTRIKQALLKLPREQLNTFLLKEEGGFSLEDIASLTGTTRETVKSRLRYAMDKLRSSLI